MASTRVRSKRKPSSKRANALRRLADRGLPAYEPDEGALTAVQLATIRRLAGRQDMRSVRSSLL